jgi:hypothetical protein
MSDQTKPRPTSWLDRIRTILWPARKRELAALDSAEIERMARDLRLPVEELVALASRPSDSAKLLYRRLKLLGIDQQGVEVAVLRDLERCCSCCDSKKECEQDLKAEAASNVTPSYCPNQQTLGALTSMKCH